MRRVTIPALKEISPSWLWRALCGQRVLLYETEKIEPPQTEMQKIGNFIHELICLSITEQRRLKTQEIIRRTTEALGGITHVSLVIAKLDSFYSIKTSESNTLYLEAEKNVRIVVNDEGHTVKDPSPRDGLSHVLYGRVDAICRSDDTLIIRDFKLSFNPKHDYMKNIKTQFGLYRICLRPFLPEYGCTDDDVRCQIVDLSSGKIIDIEPYHTGDMMEIIHKAIKIHDDCRGSKATSRCHNCPYSDYCDNPHRAPKAWKRKLVDQPSLL